MDDDERRKCVMISRDQNAPKMPDDQLLLSEVVVYTGGRDQEGRPIISFPSRQHSTLGSEVKPSGLDHILRYYVDLTSSRDKAHGLAFVTDLRFARLDFISLLKSSLNSLQAEMQGFSGKCILYAIQPQNKKLLKDAMTVLALRVSKKKKNKSLASPIFQTVFVAEEADLHNYIDRSQLMTDMGGYLQYSHPAWVRFMKAVEPFFASFHECSFKYPAAVDGVSRLAELQIGHSQEELERQLAEMRKRYDETISESTLLTTLAQGSELIHKMKHSEEDTTFSEVAQKPVFKDTYAHLRDCQASLKDMRSHVEGIWKSAESQVLQALSSLEYTAQLRQYFGKGAGDISECDESPCSTNAMCSDTAGSFSCNCLDGYDGDGFTCIDINECIDESDDCDPTTTQCINADGSFICQCLSGYETVNAASCQDINECLTDDGGCDTTTTTCRNIAGAFDCQCLDGYEFTGSFTECSDTDECNQGGHDCDLTTTQCVNTDGSFTCQCRLGFVPTDTNTTCQDVCTAGQSSCDPATTLCNFNSGIVTCSCLAGYEPIQGNMYMCQVSTGCCPTFSDPDIDNKFYLTPQGTCIFFNPGQGATPSEFKTTKCADMATEVGATGGRLLELPSEDLSESLMAGLLAFVDNLIPILGVQFPDDVVWVDLRRDSETEPFMWADGTILDPSDSDWADGFPQESTNDLALDCGGLVAFSQSGDLTLGYINADCNRESQAFCSVDNVDCPESLTARGVLRILSITFESGHNDENSGLYKQTVWKITRAFDGLPDRTEVRVKGLSEGSVIVYAELTVRKPHKIQSPEMLNEAILKLGEIDENGYLTIETSAGEIVLDSNKIDIDDLNNHLCLQNTCQNGGTCNFDDRFIEAHCQCMAGFHGERCEAIEAERSGVFIVALVVVTVVIVIISLSCFCCLLILSNGRAQRKQAVYQYRPPTSDPFASRGDPRVVVNRLAARVGGRGHNSLPRVVRNRGLVLGTEMETFDNPSMDLDHIDVESFLDNKRMRHLESVFQHASEINSRMSHRGRAVSDVSQDTTSTSSICKPSLSESTESDDGTREFKMPYTADGTLNL